MTMTEADRSASNARPARRTFTAEYKRRMLAEYDAPCSVAVRSFPVKLQDGLLHVGMEG